MEQKMENKSTIEFSIVELLQQEMKKSGYISQSAMEQIAKSTNKPVSEIYGVATFFSAFKFSPTAKYQIEVCVGSACFVLGGETLLNHLMEKLRLQQLGNTTDNLFSVNVIRCLGCCGEAPAVRINGKIYGKLTEQKLDEIINGLI